MSRTYVGNAPDNSKGWSAIGDWTDGDGVQWIVCKQQQAHTDEWATYKIYANGKAKFKANYWAVRKNTGELGFNRDMAQMRASRPDLHAMVEEIMDAQIGGING